MKVWRLSFSCDRAEAGASAQQTDTTFKRAGVQKPAFKSPINFFAVAE